MSRRRQSPLPTIAAIVLAVAFSVSLYANWSLANTGKFTLPGMANPVLAYEAPKPVEPVDQPEMVAILVPSKDLEPFDVVTSAIFYKEDGTPSVVKVQKASIENSGIVLNPNQIFGRVLMSGHEKGRPFHPSEFFPEGTQAGPTAGVPEGKFGVTVNCTEVTGLESLSYGDEVDLVATATIVAINPDTLSDEERASVETQQKMLGLDKQAQVRRVATRALVVRPVRERSVPGAKQPVLDCFIALRAEEVAALAAAIERGEKVRAVAISGRIDGDLGSEIPEVVPQDPLGPVRDLPKPIEVQVINGGKSTTTNNVRRADG